MTRYSRNFEVIDDSVEAFFPYAAGMATAMKSRLKTGDPLNAREMDWLLMNTGHATPEAMWNGPRPSDDFLLGLCQQLIDRNTLRVITARLKS